MGRRCVTELSGYLLETLREGRVCTLYRGRQPGNAVPLLLLAPVSAQQTPSALGQLEHEFALAQAVEGMLVPDFTRGFNRARDGRKIVIRANVVAIDHGGILKVVARQADRTFAGGLHQRRRDCERVRGRRTKTRGDFGRNNR